MAQAYLIRTPTDFERTVGVGDFIRAPLFSPPPPVEPAFREALDSIFADLQYVESGEPEGLALYLQDIAEPLNELWTLGFALFAVITK